MTDALGNRLKAYEALDTGRKAFKGQPLIARLDGKAFHTFCKGLPRPYDKRLSDLMIETMKALVDRFNAKVGYTQSDEITLAWYSPASSVTEYPFDGRFQKLDSLLASYATAVFNRGLAAALPEKADALPTFDCRSFVVPNLQEAYHCFLWRQQDATKNAISMAAQSMFSHKTLQGRNGAQMQEMMWTEKGINFNDYPAFFKRGTFARRVKELRALTEEQLQRIPEAHRPTEPVYRSFVDQADIWLSKQEDPLAVLFEDAPIIMGPVTEPVKKAKWDPTLAELSERLKGVPEISGMLPK